MPFDYAQLGQNLGQNLGQDVSQNVSFDPFAEPAPVRRAAPAPRGTEAGDAIDLKRQQWEAFQSEMAQAQAEYEARVKDIRPYMGETIEKLHDQILAPVLEKWGTVPGFQRPTAEHYQELKLKQDASEAARQYEGQMRVSQLIKGGMAPEKAILENSQFFAPTVQSSALRLKRPVPVPLQATPVPGMEGVMAIQTPDGKTVLRNKSADIQAVPVPGMEGVMAVTTPDGRTVLHNKPAQPEGKLSMQEQRAITLLSSELRQLETAAKDDASYVNRDPKQAKGEFGRAMIEAAQQRQKKIKQLKARLSELVPNYDLESGGEPAPSATPKLTVLSVTREGK